MDRVYIRQLTLETVIGVYDWERETRQTLKVDLEMAWDHAPAAAGDDVDRALDYAMVSGRLRELAAAGSFQLIESLAEQLAACLRAEFGVPWLRLTLWKPGAVVEADNVGVGIERGELPR